jgi:hypothetical protein
VLPSEDSELLPEREVFQDQVGPVGEHREESLGDCQSVVEHRRTMKAVGTEGNRTRPRALRISCTGAQLVEEQGGRGCGEAQDKDKVLEIRAGLQPSVSYVERC